MIDIDFYLKIARYKHALVAGHNPINNVYEYLESCRSRVPVVFNIETTNACSMTCSFCPRTTLMTRPVKTMNPEVFMNVARQLIPHPPALWDKWVAFAEKEYKIPPNQQSENAFFLYILPRVMVLHGYGDPLLDPHIPTYINMLSRLEIPSYFSCNPANINLKRLNKIMSYGLSYIKFSIDSLSDPARGRDKFERDFASIMQVLEQKDINDYQTQVIITMIDLGKTGQTQEYAQLKQAFQDTGAYVYLKSLDQAWMLDKSRPRSIHWSEFCQIPWSSMTINSSGLAVMCQEDYQGEVVLGDAKTQTLDEIWNGAEYAKLRRAHIDLTPGRCRDRCDMRIIGKWL